MTRSLFSTLFIATLFTTSNALALDQELKDDIKNIQKTTDQTYIKVGYTFTGRNIYDYPISINGVSIDAERYFNRYRLGLSGWSVGYRKEDIRHPWRGHLLNGAFFREIYLFKIIGGIESGVLPLKYDLTEIDFGADGEPIAYSHLFPHRPINLPWGSGEIDLSMYPFFEFSVVHRDRHIFEVGLRGNIMKFGINDYILEGDAFATSSKSEYIVVPSFFIKIGLGNINKTELD
jgi:hypothetical protein